MVERSSPLIEILLSTYNGEEYIDQQLESIVAQSYSNWILLVRDDGSIDSTVEKLKLFSARFPGKMRFISDNERLGPMKSFEKLIVSSKADYVAFCDQDDVWMPNKLLDSLEVIRNIEREDPRLPVLVHTDLKVVDAQLQLISRSFWQYQCLKPSSNSLKDILVQNNVTGCTIIVNRSLLNYVDYIPSAAIMHDWWLALVTAAFGKIAYIPESMVSYRQHKMNHVGALKYSVKNFINLSKIAEGKKQIIRVLQQAQAFDEMYNSFLMPLQRKKVALFSLLLHSNRIRRFIIVITCCYRKHGLLRNLAFLLVILLINRTAD